MLLTSSTIVFIVENNPVPVLLDFLFNKMKIVKLQEKEEIRQMNVFCPQLSINYGNGIGIEFLQSGETEFKIVLRINFPNPEGNKSKILDNTLNKTASALLRCMNPKIVKQVGVNFNYFLQPSEFANLLAIKQDKLLIDCTIQNTYQEYKHHFIAKYAILSIKNKSEKGYDCESNFNLIPNNKTSGIDNAAQINEFISKRKEFYSSVETGEIWA